MTILSSGIARAERLLGTDSRTRDVAKSLYSVVADHPIVSPHGHVSAQLLVANDRFSEPATLLITPDHYVTRLLHAHGIGLDELGVRNDVDPRTIWSRFAQTWHAFLGTPVRYWIQQELIDIFGIAEALTPESADDIYDRISELLAQDDYRPLALLERFRIDVLATTDDPADSLDAHRRLRDATSTSVIPTFRADRYMLPAASGWGDALRELEIASGISCGTLAGLTHALRERRQVFASAGGTSTDTGVIDAWATPLNPVDAERLHRDALAGSISASDARAYRRNMLFRLAEMSAEDGLVMQLHAGVIRNHHSPTTARFGTDTGHDLPAPTEFTRPLQDLLETFGTATNFRIVLFTVDEASFSRDIAPLAGFYPSVYAGAPWWFLDAPRAILRYREAVSETAGFYKTSGFIDDTRALCSIPVRHDMSRRLDAAYLATLVIDGQITATDAETLIDDLTSGIPRSVFRL